MYVRMYVGISVSLYICYVIDLCHVANGHGRRDTYLMSNPKFTGVSLVPEYATNISTSVMTHTGNMFLTNRTTRRVYSEKCI